MNKAEREKVKKELELYLPGFTGSEEWHSCSYPWLRCQFLLTDGAHYLAEKAKCYWFMDVIASYQSKRFMTCEDFQTWTLKVKDGKGSVKCDDGNGHVLCSQSIPYTDFPLDQIKLYVIRSGDGLTVMLPSEY